MPAARTASSALAPSSSSSATTRWSPGRACTTSTFSLAIEAPRGAPREGIDHGVGDGLEQRVECAREDAAGELVAEREFDLRGGAAERLETPVRREALERSFEQLHVDRFAVAIDVLGGERLLEALHPHGEGRHGAVRRALAHLRRDAPGQELGIGVDVLHQRIQLGSALLHDGRTADALHGKIALPPWPSSRTARRFTTTSSKSASRRGWCSPAGR